MAVCPMRAVGLCLRCQRWPRHDRLSGVVICNDGQFIRNRHAVVGGSGENAEGHDVVEGYDRRSHSFPVLQYLLPFHPPSNVGSTSSMSWCCAWLERRAAITSRRCRADEYIAGPIQPYDVFVPETTQVIRGEPHDLALVDRDTAYTSSLAIDIHHG